ncbi:flagellar basal body P-ring formation chaperone FlgA [Rhizomicrobium electricum]|jgi:flagella basal body P-ring formation protein FlgA|uniref:Flagella basal body P-ring formation protein FlgA n=1 Tax=Rhizomicrobium electricum TaxID=480070 RepID=A0ABP3QIJ7_9PROT|nr:flagellar basal body P-ring formation chaperone FlgA [Rhizomicrobium electricum]NIJ50774.1 flagella basal body P-ring formation protein FlgA [Rhizomicrobium electricum]
MMRFWLFAFALILTYPAFGGVRVVVPNRDIARGQVIAEADMTYTQINGQVMAGIATSLGDVVGLETRRTLRAGETLRLSDLRHPVLVAKGSTVTMVFEAPGVVLTATGRAMSEGGLGETVTVQNPASYRQISGIVVGPGQVQAQVGGALNPSAGNRFAAIRR